MWEYFQKVLITQPPHIKLQEIVKTKKKNRTTTLTTKNPTDDNFDYYFLLEFKVNAVRLKGSGCQASIFTELSDQDDNERIGSGTFCPKVQKREKEEAEKKKQDSHFRSEWPKPWKHLLIFTDKRNGLEKRESFIFTLYFLFISQPIFKLKSIYIYIYIYTSTLTVCI